MASMFSKCRYEFTQALIGLLGAKGFSASFVFTLALTQGGLIAAFSLHYTIALKPLPYPDAERLFVLQQSMEKSGKSIMGVQQVGAHLSLHQQTEVAATPLYRVRDSFVSHRDEPRVISLYTMTDYFTWLSPDFALGRGFSPMTMDEAKAEAVISYPTWQRLFAGKPDILGESIQLGEEYYRVIGVLAQEGALTPEAFTLYGDTQVFLPFAFADIDANDSTTIVRSFSSLVKLAPNQEITPIENHFSQIIKEYIDGSEMREFDAHINFLAHLTPLDIAIRGDQGEISLLILMGAGLLLLVAFANISNLYLSHVEARKYILAISASVGASPMSLFIKLFMESLLLVMVSLGFALLVAAWLFRLIQVIAIESFARLDELTLDLNTILFSLLVCLVLASSLALISSLKLNYKQLKQYLTASGKGVSPQANQMTRQLLIGSQMTFASLILLASSVVLGQALSTANKPLGFMADRVLSIQLKAGRETTPDELATMLSLSKQHFSDLPQVELVSKNYLAPIRKGDFGITLQDENQQNPLVVALSGVDQDYFNLLELPILYGRSFTSAEIEDSANTIVISEALALERFGKSNAVGEYLYMVTGTAFEVVGIAQDYFNAHTYNSYKGQQVYFPVGTFRANLLVKLKPEQHLSKTAILAELRKVDPRLLVGEFSYLSETEHQQVAQYRLVAYFTLGMSLLALTIAASGIYGVMSYSGQLRKFELGVRMALGATPRKLTLLMLKQSMTPVLLGFMLSIVFTFIAYFILGDELVSYGAPHWQSLLLACGVLLSIALLAAYKPLYSLLKANPIHALRNQ